MLNLDLQWMAENAEPDEGADTDHGPGGKPDEGKPGANEPKTYTQEEVDRITASVRATERRNVPAEDELQAFRQWKNSRQAGDDTAQRLQAIEAKLAKAEQEAAELRNLDAVRQSGVGEEFTRFAKFEAQKLVTDEKDFQTALDEWLEANPQFKQTARATGMRRGGSPPQIDGVERHFRELNPTLKLD